MPFFDEIYEDPDINFVLVRHEQSAGHAAEGYAAASGKLGLCVTTSGPGATNIITPLADAYYDSRPILAFSGQVRRMISLITIPVPISLIVILRMALLELGISVGVLHL